MQKVFAVALGLEGNRRMTTLELITIKQIRSFRATSACAVLQEIVIVSGGFNFTDRNYTVLNSVENYDFTSNKKSLSSSARLVMLRC